jgi:7,8-dihydropterin-6-yl-methyl-4-(beta-D-ribofuranosyl)aminobenzene 5'-phosphate synthase
MSDQELSRRAELVRVEEPLEVFEGVLLTGPIPRTTDFEDTGGDFFTDRRCATPDDLIDDQAAAIQTPTGTVVVLGCAHAGIVNTLRHVRDLTDNRPIHTVIGGMHLLNASDERMDKTVAELRSLNVRRLVPCHCTGFAAMARFFNEFPGRCRPCQTGTVVDVEA